MNKVELDAQVNKLSVCKAMRSVKRYASYAKNPEFRVIPLPLNSVFNENNSVTLTLT